MAGQEPLLECVPNLSEGRRLEVVERLAKAAVGPGVALLDLSSDADHHRSVVTLAGRSSALHEGLLALCQAAFERIDLGRHQGAHPRVGAVDLVPFVPLAGATMADAVAAARRLAEALAEGFQIPVFLYGAAASEPRRRHPVAFRRGGLEGLARRLASGEEQPDHGPRVLHPTAGAVLVGARDFLIAVNARLIGATLEQARAVARRIRESSGGLPGVQALGLSLPSRDGAQVSMNLLDFRRTGLARLLDRVREVAQEEGAQVGEVEIVGLVPEAALYQGARRLPELEALVGDQVVEHRLGKWAESTKA